MTRKCLVTYSETHGLWLTEFNTPKEKILIESVLSGLSDSLADVDIYWYPQDINEMPNWMVEELEGEIPPRTERIPRHKPRFDDED